VMDTIVPACWATWVPFNGGEPVLEPLAGVVYQDHFAVVKQSIEDGGSQ
jgi:hypothetical protein